MPTAQATMARHRGRDARMPGDRKRHTRKELKRFPVRFGIHLRSLMDAKGWQTADVAKALAEQGVEIGKPAIQKWLRGDTVPDNEHLRPLGRAFGLSDYRLVLPPE